MGREKILFAAVITGTACIVVMSLMAAAIIFRDISSLRDDIMMEMGNVRVRFGF